MANLLHISASPRGAASQSLAVANAFLATYRENHPFDTIETWDLWDGSLPEFGPDAARAKMAVFAGSEPDHDAQAAWDAAIATFNRFASADAYLFSVPMWNSSMPYILKQFIDLVSQPGHAFNFDPVHGYSGLVRDKPATVIYSSAVWGPGRPTEFGEDFLQPSFEHWLRWIGIQEIQSIRIQPNLVVDDPERVRAEALADARALAERFAIRNTAGLLR